MAHSAIDREAETSTKRLFTVEEYYRMAEAGILAEDERVELIRGEIRRMSPKYRRHILAVRRVFDALVPALQGRASVYQEVPLAVAELDSELEPDILVCSNPDVEAYGTDDTKPLLIVEVSESTLRFDLGDKANLYAESGVPEYWVLNLVDETLVVFRDPHDGKYRDRSVVASEEMRRPSRGRTSLSTLLH